MRFDFQSMMPIDRYELLLGTIMPRPITSHIGIALALPTASSCSAPCSRRQDFDLKLAVTGIPGNGRS